MQNNYDITIIGGGPGGYVSAIRASQLGKSVCLVEKHELGGTCLNVGCIPTKALLNVSNNYINMQKVDQIGISCDNLDIDWSKAQNYKNTAVNNLVNGVYYLLEKNNVQVYKGRASFVDENRIQVSGEETIEISSKYFVVATGASNTFPPIEGLNIDDPDVYDSNGILSIENIPDKLTIIGGGVIGLEFAYIFSSLGTDVTIIEVLPDILNDFDAHLREAALSSLKDKGVKVYTNTSVNSVKESNAMKEILCSNDKEEFSLSTESILVATGRGPNTKALNLDKIGVKLEENGALSVNNYLQTNIPHIYGVGDVLGKELFAHVAYKEGSIAVENALGEEAREMDYTSVPKAIFMEPQIASVGMTEAKAKEEGYNVKSGIFPLMSNGKAVILNETSGFAKVVTDEDSTEVIGVHLCTPNAGDLISSGTLALDLEALREEFGSSMFVHPTISEALHEASLATMDRVIHV